MDRDQLIELNKIYGENPLFQIFLRNEIKRKFENEVVQIEKRRRVQNG